MDELMLLPIPMVMAFCEFAKLIGLPVKAVPFVAVVAGILISLGANEFAVSFNNVMLGFMYGFSAIGIYSGVKNTVQ